MAGSTARAAATHWFIPGVTAVAMHLGALVWSSVDLERPFEELTAAERHVTIGHSIDLLAEAPSLEDEVSSKASPTEPSSARPPAKSSRPTPARPAASKPASAGRSASDAKATQPPPDGLTTSSTGTAGSETTTTNTDQALTAAGSAGTNGAVAGSAVAGAQGVVRGGVSTSKPRLLSSGLECHGVLPGSILAGPTKVTLVLRVSKDGTASTTAVKADRHAHVPGLEAAAQRCAQRLRFAPARAEDGSAVVASSVVRLTFSNHYTATLAPRSAGTRRNSI